MKKLAYGVVLLGLIALSSMVATAQTSTVPYEGRLTAAQGLTAAGTVLAQPTTIPYEGRLTAASGARLGQDTATISFSIYDDPSVGTLLWGPETHDAVSLDNGVFNVQLGTFVSLPGSVFSGADRYLQITVRGEVLSPRQPIGSVPYAFRSGQVITLAGAAGGDVTGNVYISGQVGIGTTVPVADLHIVGSAGATGTYASGTNLLIDNGDFQRFITMRGPNSGQTGILFSNSESFVDGGLRYFPSATAGSERLDVLSGGSVRVAVMGSGNVGIGTLAPAALLHVNGTAGNNTGVWSNLSDRRLKKDIEPIEKALETVGQLQGVTFHWKDAEKDAQFGRVRGLIAQDVEKVLPEWIKTDPDGYKRLEPIGIDALLIEAIKEQQKQIEELKEQISKLTVGLQKGYGQK